MPTANRFDDPERDARTIGLSRVGGMADKRILPKMRVANAFLVTEAQEPNAILRTGNDDTRALEDQKMSVLSRSDLVLTIKDETKMCAWCPRGSRLQFALGRFLKWRKCRRHLTSNEKALLALKLMEAEAGGLTDAV